MTFTSARPIWVDGVRLDTLGWNIEAITRAVAPRRANDVIAPGLDGVLPSYNDDLDDVPFGLDMFVRGTDLDGTVPAQGGLDQFRDNLDELLHLFGKRHALLDVWMSADDNPVVNQVLDPTGMGLSGTYLQNPTAVQNSTGTTTSFNAAAVTAGDGPAGLSLPGYMRLTYVANNGSQGRGFWAWFPVAGVYEISLYVRPSRAGMTSGSMTIGQPSGATYSVTTGGSTLSDTPSPMTAGAWTRTVKRYKVVNPGLGYVGMLFSSATAGLVAGDTVDITGIMVTQLSSVNDAVVPFAYAGMPGMAWSGPANRSASVSSFVRRAYAKVIDTITPDVDIPGTSGRFSVALSLVEGSWRDMATVDTAAISGLNVNPYADIPALAGATERTNDSVFVVTGPATNPKVWDGNTGASVTLTKVLAAGDTWRVNVATWASRTALSGAPLTLDSLDTDGTDAQALTSFGGIRNQTHFLPLVPIREGSNRRVRFRLTGTAGVTAATSITWRTLRRFAA